MTLEMLEEQIFHLEVEKQRKLLHDLPRLLKIPFDDLLFLKTAQNSFGFWNNPEDEIYDDL